jgi:protein-L-isoaspartate(D-aspartate) O-methyltransferase
MIRTHLLILSILLAVPVPEEPETDPYLARRLEMVRSQIEERGIDDPRLLDAMRRVPRHLFVPEPHRDAAYEDAPQPIGEGQTISQPYIVALMTQLLDLQGNEKVLEVGTGSGYQAAVLAELAGEIYTVEILPTLHERAADLLGRLGYRNVHLRCGNGYRGWEENAPYDAILVTAAPPHIPQPLISQLADGGILVVPVGEASPFQTLKKIRKAGDELVIDNITPVRFVPLVLPKSTPGAP